jgi:alpha-tubulin suppressor-like RCC1 family protein
LYLWGKTTSNVIEKPDKVITISSVVEDVSLGTTVHIAKDTKGMPWAWGLNKHAELGFGDNEPRDYPFPVSSLINKKVTQVACGGGFTICLGQHISQMPIDEI